VASTTIISLSDTELSLQDHLNIAPDPILFAHLVADGDPEPLMMAQPVPHQSGDKRRVKVYELRNNDWQDRGTGFCTAKQVEVRHGGIAAACASLHTGG
jgi:protein phosphatase 4 regulatory subunit 3